MKTTRPHTRRPMPRTRTKAPRPVVAPRFTVGDLVSAAYDALHETGSVLRVLGSSRMAERIGRKLVFLERGDWC